MRQTNKINKSNQTAKLDHLAYVEKYNIWSLQSNLSDIVSGKECDASIVPAVWDNIVQQKQQSPHKQDIIVARVKHQHCPSYWLSLL